MASNTEGVLKLGMAVGLGASATFALLQGNNGNNKNKNNSRGDGDNTQPLLDREESDGTTTNGRLNLLLASPTSPVGMERRDPIPVREEDLQPVPKSEDMDTDEPPFELDFDNMEQPRCWCCPCDRLCRESCGENPQPIQTRSLDCIAHQLYWLSGMYSPNGTFRRWLWNCVTSANETSAGKNTKYKVISRDLDIKGTHCDAIPIRIYEPYGDSVRSLPRPIMLWLHGGGFCIGNRAMTQMDEVCCKFASKGFVVVSVSYRLAPEHPFPAATQDSYDVMAWISDGKDSLMELPPDRCDRSRFVVSGDSAGGNLTAALGVLARDGLDGDLRPSGRTISISYLVMVYPALFLQHPDKETRTRMQSIMSDTQPTAFIPMPVRRWFMDSYIPGGTMALPNLIRHDVRLSPFIKGWHNLPPCTIVAAELDILRHENIEAAKLMQQYGQKCILRVYRNVPHGFLTFIFLKEADEAFKDLIFDLRHVLRGRREVA